MSACQPPPRSWRTLVSPQRVLLGLIGVAAVTWGATSAPDEGQEITPLALVAVGAVLLLSAWLLPAVREVELGFPVGVKVKSVIRDREESLRQAFTAHQADLELIAQLLCENPATAKQLLEAAWSRTTATWRGPVTPAVRLLVLCQLVALHRARSRWAGAESASSSASPLSALAPEERLAVVLSDFAGLSLTQISAITGLDGSDIEAARRRGTERAEAAREAPP